MRESVVHRFPGTSYGSSLLEMLRHIIRHESITPRMLDFARDLYDQIDIPFKMAHCLPEIFRYQKSSHHIISLLHSLVFDPNNANYGDVWRVCDAFMSRPESMEWAWVDLLIQEANASILKRMWDAIPLKHRETIVIALMTHLKSIMMLHDRSKMSNTKWRHIRTDSTIVCAFS